MLNDSKAVDFRKQFLGLLQTLLLDLEHLMFIARLTENSELPRRRPRVAGEKASVLRLQKRMALVNRIQLPLNPASGNAGDRHQHEQRPQTEPEPAAFRFGFGHGGFPRGGSVYRDGQGVGPKRW